MTENKQVDESWKDEVATEKEKIAQDPAPKTGDVQESGSAGDNMEINFLNYISSLAFQAMIFLGLMPNPVAGNKIEKDLKQAKFLIDTLVMLRDKTKGNLSAEEEKILGGSIYELQMQYVEQMKKPDGVSQ